MLYCLITWFYRGSPQVLPRDIHELTSFLHSARSHHIVLLPPLSSPSPLFSLPSLLPPLSSPSPIFSLPSLLCLFLSFLTSYCRDRADVFQSSVNDSSLSCTCTVVCGFCLRTRGHRIEAVFGLVVCLNDSAIPRCLDAFRNPACTQPCIHLFPQGGPEQDHGSPRPNGIPQFISFVFFEA